MNQASDGLKVGFCAGCGSENLEPLPPNKFSRKPGYNCAACGTMHRGAKSTWLYAAIVVLGLCMAGAGITIFSTGGPPSSGAPRKSPLRLVFMGVAVAGWAGWQFRVPVVARDKPQ